jgi:hypothetical protein
MPQMSFGDWLGIIGLVVSVAGFWIAIVQLRRTADATEATAVATKATAEKIEQTLDRMNVNHILVLLPQMRLAESDLDHATENDDRRLAQRALISYAHLANQLASLVEKVDGSDASTVSRLKDSARAASAAKSALVTGRAGVRTATKDVAAEISDLAGMSAGLIAKYQSKVG